MINGIFTRYRTVPFSSAGNFNITTLSKDALVFISVSTSNWVSGTIGYGGSRNQILADADTSGHYSPTFVNSGQTISGSVLNPVVTGVVHIFELE